MRWIKPMISGRWCKVVRIFAKLSNGIDNDKVSSANFRHLVSRLSLNQVVRHYHLVLLVVLGFVPSSCRIFLWKLLKHNVTVDSISTWVTDYSPRRIAQDAKCNIAHGWKLKHGWLNMWRHPARISQLAAQVKTLVVVKVVKEYAHMTIGQTS